MLKSIQLKPSNPRANRHAGASFKRIQASCSGSPLSASVAQCVPVKRARRSHDVPATRWNHYEQSTHVRRSQRMSWLCSYGGVSPTSDMMLKSIMGANKYMQPRLLCRNSSCRFLSRVISSFACLTTQPFTKLSYEI